MKIKSKEGTLNTITFHKSAAAKVLPQLTASLIEAAQAYIPYRTNSSASHLNSAFNILIQFCFSQSILSESKKYNSIEDFDIELTHGFYHYLKLNYDIRPAFNKYKISRKAILDYIKEKNIKHSKNLAFPIARSIPAKPTDPLPKKTLNNLFSILTKRIDNIIEKKNLKNKLIKNGKILNIEEIKLESSKDYSLKNICFLYKYHYKEENNRHTQNLLPKIRKCEDANVAKMKVSEFVVAYNKNKWSKLADTGRHPKGTPITSYNLKLEDVVTTLVNLYPNYPLNTNIDELRTKYCGSQTSNGAKSFKDVKNEFEYFRYKEYVHHSCETKKYNFCGNDINSWWEIIELLYPNAEDMVAILLMIMLQTGWNKETVFNININDYTHALSDLNENNSVLIKSYKIRGQQDINLPYSQSKPIYFCSNKKEKYSAYNLFKLLIDITNPLRESQYYKEIKESNQNKDIAFLCLKNEYRWGNKKSDNILVDLNNKKIYSIAMKHFLNKNELNDENGRIDSSEKLTSRLRTTWKMIKQDTGIGKEMMSILMGHSSYDITDEHYDNSPTAIKRRLNNLINEMTLIESDLKTGQFRGTLIPNRIGDRDRNAESKFKYGNIFVDDKNERLICICKDSSNPQFYQHELYVREDKPCKFITKCLLCPQSLVTRNSLPYIIDRRQYILEQESILSKLIFEELYSDELSAIQYVLENWEDKNDIEEAEIFQMENYPLLPAMPNIAFGEQHE
ncbi:hypothetical protein D5018_08520 [Parashewanella curva]|uniref:Uncharacterized protein n=1 Tax=Parashewanella curva TaxID=2338552 RepID=A0A3L8Q051_9GAMM|nr:hypothetical protein [Parashewanella curva]RLV60168.1 hypothetical protein D5018_08520 [Parashewanella curva]